jgi:nicotinate-nucleotide adenylyltransferase
VSLTGEAPAGAGTWIAGAAPPDGEVPPRPGLPSRFRLQPSGLVRLPPAASGLRVGLYGGSFNPAHAGHRHVSLMALKRLGLDRVWWIVTPGNPLKNPGEAAPMAERLAQARTCAAHPRIAVTGFEEGIGVRYTIDTLRFLIRRHPEMRFVWLMGADNLASFHRWRGWREIAGLMPIAIIDRPGWTLKAVGSRAGVALGTARIPESQARVLADLKPPAWTFLHGPRSFLSSTEIRRRRKAASQQS